MSFQLPTSSLEIPYSYVGDKPILDYAYPLDSGVDIFAKLTFADGTFNPDSVVPAGEDYTRVWIDSSNLSCVLSPNGAALFSTGLQFDLNAHGVIYLQAVVNGREVLLEHRLGLQVRTTSGRAFKTRMVVANSPGTIDQKYTNELKILVWNTSSDEVLVIREGDKIAQIVAELVPHIDYQLEKTILPHLAQDDRGTKGFGSSPTSLEERDAQKS